jgi:hypothetical protein
VVIQGQDGPRAHHISPEPVAHLSQHLVLPLLLRSATAADACGGVHFGHAVEALESTKDGTVRVEVRSSQVRIWMHEPSSSGTSKPIRRRVPFHSIGQRCCAFRFQGRQVEVLTQYLVAADGAKSRVRGMVGVSMEGNPALQHLVNIHFMAPGLKDRLKHREAMLYFVFNSRVIAVIVAHDIQREEFVAQVRLSSHSTVSERQLHADLSSPPHAEYLWCCSESSAAGQVPYFPPMQSLADFPNPVCQRLLRDAIGVPDVDVQILSVRTWTMHAEVAQKFKVEHPSALP